MDGEMEGWRDGWMNRGREGEREEAGISDCLDALRHSLVEYVRTEKKTGQGVQERGDKARVRYDRHLLLCALYITPIRKPSHSFSKSQIFVHIFLSWYPKPH